MNGGVSGPNAASSDGGGIYNSGTITTDDVTANSVTINNMPNVNYMPTLMTMPSGSDANDVGRPVTFAQVDDSSRLTLTNSVIANNTATNGGTGVVNSSAGGGSITDPGMILQNVTVADNVVMIDGEDSGVATLNLEFATLNGTLTTASQQVNAMQSVITGTCSAAVTFNAGSYSTDSTCGVTTDGTLSVGAFDGFEYPLTGVSGSRRTSTKRWLLC